MKSGLFNTLLGDIPMPVKTGQDGFSSFFSLKMKGLVRLLKKEDRVSGIQGCEPLESHCDRDHKNAGTFLTEEKTLC
jgi:hypothetical protein